MSAVLWSNDAFAVQGQCVNCHTMHNSQNGVSVTGGAPNDVLLNAGCVACHTAAAAGQQTSQFGAPAVLHLTAPTGQGAGNTNAGGDFYWVTQGTGTSTTTGHNVADITGVGQDTLIGLTPPGWDPIATTGFTYGQVANGTAAWSNQLTCAGTYGCHGNHALVGGQPAGSFAGIKGAHHSNPNVGATRADAPTNVGGSFRFLGGILGLEDANWNWNETSAAHNEYYGVDNQANRNWDAASGTYADRTSISFLCAECHGMFHSRVAGTTAGGSPWRRHPTDIALPNTSEYAAYTAYSVQAPVARPTVPTASNGVVTPGTDVVICLSCHRAHGSPFSDLLRWDYTTMIAGQASADTGCFTCHTTKNNL